MTRGSWYDLREWKLAETRQWNLRTDVHIFVANAFKSNVILCLCSCLLIFVANPRAGVFLEEPAK